MERDVRRVRTSVNDGILGYYTKFRRIGLNDLELHRSHSTTDKESVAFANRPIGYEWSICKDHNG